MESGCVVVSVVVLVVVLVKLVAVVKVVAQLVWSCAVLCCSPVPHILVVASPFVLTCVACKGALMVVWWQLIKDRRSGVLRLGEHCYGELLFGFF